MINFESLPDSFAGGNDALLDEGWYRAVIKRAEMRQSKSGAEYLSIMLNINGHNVFDILMESDKPLLQFKLKQFIKALQLNLHGDFELRDLVKVIINKELMACVAIQKNPGYADRNGINIFDNGGYKPVVDDNTDELPFDMSDESPFNATNVVGAESY